MFTGIVEEIGIIKDIKKNSQSASLLIACKKVLEGSQIGDSIAVNGVCLTVTSIGSNEYSADVMAETLDRSSLGNLKKGDRVNLERAMPANGRFGGHIVSGHIDGIGKIASIDKDEMAVWYKIETSEKILKYIVEKGSIAIDGISLTVAKVTSKDFCVSIIPHSQGNTILSDKKISDIVNLENDIVGKYVEKLIGNKKEESKITMEYLADNGFI